MKTTKTCYSVCVFFSLILVAGLPQAFAASGKSAQLSGPPDLIKGEQRDTCPEINLGPTGARGWVWSGGPAGSRDTRQILVTVIAKGSPADGKLKINDVIVGAGGKIFDSDARKAFAQAITEAERKENAGALRLTVCRDGKNTDVTLLLKVMGRYSNTSPYNCEKTKAIVDMVCNRLKEKPLKGGLQDDITALGLMSTGREDVMPKVRPYAHDICVPGEVLSLETLGSKNSWSWGYKCLFLTEYYLYTRDDYVLPTLKEYATKIAMGQSGVGTWGQAMCPKDINGGRLHGSLGGYGAMNQIGLVCMMSLVLAEKCGVHNDEISQAIRRGAVFFDFYINKGSIPYGDHPPRIASFDDNGKSASAAVLFDMMGNEKGASFFSAMALGAAPAGRESGHTGCFFNQLWGGMGAARSGEACLTAFTREMRWYYELQRDWEGAFYYQRPAGRAIGSNNKYGGWDASGGRLLQFCLPLKKLYLTGKAMTISSPMSESRAETILAHGRLKVEHDDLKKLDQKTVLQLLKDPLPTIRELGADALAMQNINCVDQLIAMLDSNDVHERYGACQALQTAGFKSSKAVDQLLEKAIKSEDIALRWYAIDALIGPDPEKGLAVAAKPAIPSLLKLAVTRSPQDPRRLTAGKLASALCYSGRADGYKGLLVLHGIDDIDRSLLIPAIKEMLTVDDGKGRSDVSSLYDKLKPEDLEKLWGDIYLAARDRAPSGEMFADGVRGAGVRLMQKNGFAEGIDIATAMLCEKRWGLKGRLWSCLPVLEAYGGSAKKALPVLEAFANDREKGNDLKNAASMRKVIKAIETGKDQKLKSIMPYVKEKQPRDGVTAPGNTTVPPVFQVEDQE